MIRLLAFFPVSRYNSNRLKVRNDQIDKEALMRQENDLGKDPIGRLVVRIALPSMLAQLVNVLYNIVDRMYIGKISRLSDISNVHPVYNTVKHIHKLSQHGGKCKPPYQLPYPVRIQRRLYGTIIPAHRLFLPSETSVSHE